MTKREAVPQDKRASRSEAFRRYYKANRERELKRARTNYAAHREEVQERSAAWRGAHTEQAADYRRTYYQENKEHIEDKRRGRLAEQRRVRGKSMVERVADTMEHPEEYILETLGIELRSYQRAPLWRVLESVEKHLGDTIVLMFPRQSGKDEFLLDLILYLADLYAPTPASMIVVNPTYRPQTQNALQRFDAAVQANHLTHGEWLSQGSFMRRLGQVNISFLSGEPTANVTGATASLLLVINEAQDIAPQVYHQKFEPMAASMNATRILAGTAWTSQTLLAQEMRAAEQAEKADGRRRVYTVDARTVRKAAPWYGAHVDAIVRAHGRQHPLVKTQYFNEAIDAEMGMFNAARRALMQSDQRSLQDALRAAFSSQPSTGHTYAFCIDVAGQDEMRSANGGAAGRGRGSLDDFHPPWDGTGRYSLDARSADRSPDRYSLDARSADRDATTLSIIDIDLSTVETLQAPTYRVVQRMQWTGVNHLHVFGKLRALAETWRPQHIVIDATGVGEGLWAMLDRAFPTKVMPVKFSAEKKSEIGYRFLSIIETGRFKDVSAISSRSLALSNTADKQYAACQAEVLTGPRKTMRWGVPEGTRDENGELVHDDMVVADALVAELDALEWSIHFETFIIPSIDPLEEMSRFR